MLLSLVADHMENVNIYDIKTNHCPICIARLQQLGIQSKNPLPCHTHADHVKLYQS